MSLYPTYATTFAYNILIFKLLQLYVLEYFFLYQNATFLTFINIYNYLIINTLVFLFIFNCKKELFVFILAKSNSIEFIEILEKGIEIFCIKTSNYVKKQISINR